MRAAFNTIEMAYLLMGEEHLKPETAEHRRLNKKVVDELAKEVPDHEKIHLLLNAINTVQNGEQQTTTAFPSEEKPQTDPIKGIKRWIHKISKKRNKN